QMGNACVRLGALQASPESLLIVQRHRTPPPSESPSPDKPYRGVDPCTLRESGNEPWPFTTQAYPPVRSRRSCRRTWEPTCRLKPSRGGCDKSGGVVRS